MSIFTLFFKVFYKVMEMENKKHSLFLFDVLKIYDNQKIAQHDLAQCELLSPSSLTLFRSIYPLCTARRPICSRLFQTACPQSCHSKPRN